MVERDPVEALAEKAPRMGRAAIVVNGKRPADLTQDAKMAKVAAFRDIAGERLGLRPGLGGGRLKHDLVVLLIGKAVALDLTAREIIGREFPYGQLPGKTRRERIRGIVVLM